MTSVKIENHTGGDSKIPHAIEFHKRQIEAFELGVANAKAKRERTIAEADVRVERLQAKLDREQAALDALLGLEG